MDNKKELKVECSTISVKKPDLGELYHITFNQPVIKAPTAENLENRFKRLIGQEDNIHDKTSLRKNFLKKN